MRARFPIKSAYSLTRWKNVLFGMAFFAYCRRYPEMAKRFPQFHLITQNVDGLHQRAGSQNVIELHGNTTYATCLDCAQRFELDWVRAKFEQSGRAPDCPDCLGYIKTATISFGQAMPVHEMQRAEELTRACDLFLVIGSSLVVWPAAGFPLMAKRNDAKLVIINREPTDFDDIADLVINADIGTVLASAADLKRH